MREAPSPKTMRKLGRIGLALHWANVRRLVDDDQPEVHGAIASAWDYDEKALVKSIPSSPCLTPWSKLDLLLLTVAKTRHVHQNGIRFQGQMLGKHAFCRSSTRASVATS